MMRRDMTPALTHLIGLLDEWHTQAKIRPCCWGEIEGQIQRVLRGDSAWGLCEMTMLAIAESHLDDPAQLEAAVRQVGDVEKLA